MIEGQKQVYKAVKEPMPLPYHKDENGKPKPWRISSTRWYDKLDQSVAKATKAVDKTINAVADRTTRVGWWTWVEEELNQRS